MTMPRIIGADELRPFLSIAGLMEPVKEAFIALSRGRGQSPAAVLHPTTQADLHVKSAVIAGWPIFTVKMAGWSAVLHQRGEQPSSGMIAVFDAETCRPMAILQDDHLISDYRTAAAGALAARYLARQNARSAAIFGTGTQAYLQALAVAGARPLRTIYICGRQREKSARLAASLAKELPNIRLVTDAAPRAAVENADIVVTATNAREPVLFGEWLSPGQHVTSVGADDTQKYEVDFTCLQRADIFLVDSIDAARAYGNLHSALKSHFAAAMLTPMEIGRGLAGGGQMRRDDDQITLASFVGLGLQDLAVTRHVLEQMKAAKTGADLAAPAAQPPPIGPGPS